MSGWTVDCLLYNLQLQRCLTPFSATLTANKTEKTCSSKMRNSREVTILYFFYVNLSPVFIFLGLMNRIQCSFLPQPTAGSESVGKYTAPVQKRQLFPELRQTSPTHFVLPRRVRGPERFIVQTAFWSFYHHRICHRGRIGRIQCVYWS